METASKYPFRVVRADSAPGTRDGLCSEHKTQAAAEKMVDRLVAMSRGHKTRTDWRIEANT